MSSDMVQTVDDDGPISLHDPPAARRSRGQRVRRALLAIAILLVAVAGGAVATGFVISEKLGNNIERIPNVFGPLDVTQRPAATESLTFLLVGTDSRSPEPTTGTDATAPEYVPGAQRSDVIMVFTVSPDRSQASVISIPRDSWVPIPGRGMGKINAAYSYGGPTLLVNTVEQLTKLRIDHFMVIDFAGFREMTDAVGGIDVYVAQDTRAFRVDFRQGLNHLDGTQALAYVRQRYDLPNGDLDRGRRHQNVLKALLDKAANSGLLSHPLQTYDLVEALSRSISVDDTLDNGALRSLALELSDLRSPSVRFVSAPVRGLGYEGDQSVVYLDDARSTELWDAVAQDRVGEYLQRHPDERLAPAPA